MDKAFSSDEIPLGDLLKSAEQGALQLPDFQRGWVWDDNHIKSLLASISLSYPIGAVMTLKTGGADISFAARPLEGATCDPVSPDMLLLDGQQRMTSLFLALKSQEPVPTRDARGHKINRHYYASITASINPSLDREDDAIISVAEDRIKRGSFGRTIELDLSTRDKEIAAGMFPLDIILDSDETFDWQMSYLESNDGKMTELAKNWKRFVTEIIKPFNNYQVPVIQLHKSTTKEAVCQVFEKVNTGGVTLTIFELLTATYAAEEFKLREDWDRRCEKFKQHDILDQLQKTEFLQIVTLLSTYDRHALADRDAPAVSCKRREILRLPLSEYKKWADPAMDGLARAARFLRGESMFQRRDLPYASQLIPLAAIFGTLGDVAETFQNRQRLSRWYWCGVLGELYGGSTDTRLANDIQDCVAWLRNPDDQEIPRTVRDAQFQAGRLLALRTRISAAYKGLYALQMKSGAREFRTGDAIDNDSYVDQAIDIHHIFPRRWCENNGISAGIANCIVNKTAIDAHTSRIIRGHAPSQYLPKIEKDEGVDHHLLDRVLRSHDIDPVALRHDDFGSFFNDRFEGLIQQIERIMGKMVNRGTEGDESPFIEVPGARQVDKVMALIKAGESETVEFKATGRKNRFTEKKDPRIEWAVVKSLCAFLNLDGGTLLVGVGDDGSIVGIEEDFPFLKVGNTDHWSLWLMNRIVQAANPVAATYLKVSFVEIDEKTVARIDVKPSISPVFAAGKEGRKLFFVRTGPATVELGGEDLVLFLKKDFGM